MRHNEVSTMAQAGQAVPGRTRPHHWGNGVATGGALPGAATTTTPGNSYIYIIAILGALNGLLVGYDTGIISGALLFIKRPPPGVHGA